MLSIALYFVFSNNITVATVEVKNIVPLRSLLDRAIANTAWSDLFPTASCLYLAYEGSNHKPFLSVFEKGKRRPRGLFRYYRRLNDNEEVKKLIKETWQAAASSSIVDRITATRKPFQNRI